jgi:hypothetical protein
MTPLPLAKSCYMGDNVPAKPRVIQLYASELVQDCADDANDKEYRPLWQEEHNASERNRQTI